MRERVSSHERRDQVRAPGRETPYIWYNLVSDLPSPPPPVLHPGTGKPVGPDDLAPLFPMSLIAQEVTTEREVEIPAPVREIYRKWRPTALQSRARPRASSRHAGENLFQKRECQCSRQPQAEHRRRSSVLQQGGRREAPDDRDRSGPVGLVGRLRGGAFGIDVQVFMVKVSYHQKPYRRALMETYGARCIPSPSMETAAGRAVLEQHPDSPGSLGIAISEAVELAAQREDTKYALGSVLNHVLLHQTVIGLEALQQFELANDYPDIVIGCAGGGSNFAGIAFPFIGAKLRGGPSPRIIAVEPSACPSLTRGVYAYDFGDTAHLTPLTKMYTLGSAFVPSGFHAGGLRYHGMAPLVSHALSLGLIEARAYHQRACFEAGVQFARAEGIVPAPETSHAIRAAIDEALRCKEEGKSRTILFNLSGHGHFDMQSYSDYFAGKLTDQPYDEVALKGALEALPKTSAEYA